MYSGNTINRGIIDANIARENQMSDPKEGE